MKSIVEDKIAEIIYSNDLVTASHTIRLILDAVAETTLDVDAAIDSVCEKEFG